MLLSIHPFHSLRIFAEKNLFTWRGKFQFFRDGIPFFFFFLSLQTILLRREGYREREEPVGYNSGFNPHMKHSVEPLQVLLRRLLMLWLMPKSNVSASSVHYQAVQWLQCSANYHHSFQVHWAWDPLSLKSKVFIVVLIFVNLTTMPSIRSLCLKCFKILHVCSDVNIFGTICDTVCMICSCRNSLHPQRLHGKFNIYPPLADRKTVVWSNINEDILWFLPEWLWPECRKEELISPIQASSQLGYLEHQRGGYTEVSGLPGQRLSTASLASSTPSYQSSSTSR